MADQKISQLTGGGAAQATDEYVVARAGGNNKITGANVAAAATSVGTLTSLTVSGDITASAGSSTDPSITFSGYTNWGFGIDGTGLRVVAGGAGTTTTFTTTGLTTSNAVVSGDLTVDTSTLKVDSTNNRVGIGTASPAYPAQVYNGQATGYGLAVGNGASGTAGDFAGLLMHTSGSATAPLYNGAIRMQTTASAPNFQNPAMVFLVQNSGTSGLADLTEKMRLDTSGNLGLGVTPTEAFCVKRGASTAAYGEFAGNNNTPGSTSALYGQDAGGNAYAWNRANLPLLFGTNNTERARITSGGYFKASNTGTYNNSTASYHELYSTADAPTVVVKATEANYTSAVVYADAVRAASSAYKFYTSYANNVEQFYVRGDGVIYAQNTTVQSISDARLKDNVTDAADGLAVITALRPVRFDWKAGYGNDRKNQLGFIAQEVEAVFPEAVSEWVMDEPTGEVDEDGKPITEKVDYKTVGPGALIPVLVKAIQELEARIAVLEAGA